MKKYIAPRAMTVNGGFSPCDCTGTVTCGYCVQANLLIMGKKFKAEDEAVKGFITGAKKNGIRRTAREIGTEEKSLRRWINSGNIPFAVLEKFAEMRHA